MILSNEKKKKEKSSSSFSSSFNNKTNKILLNEILLQLENERQINEKNKLKLLLLIEYFNENNLTLPSSFLQEIEKEQQEEKTTRTWR